MTSSPGIRQPPNSGLLSLPQTDSGTLRRSNQLPRLLFLEPADDLRSHNTQTNHAAPASRSRRVAGPRGVHAYSVPPVITQSVNPAHSKAPFVSQAKDNLEGFAGWQKDLRAS